MKHAERHENGVPKTDRMAFRRAHWVGTAKPSCEQMDDQHSDSKR